MSAKSLTTKDAFYPFLYFPMVTFSDKHFLASVFSNELYQYKNARFSLFIVSMPSLPFLMRLFWMSTKGWTFLNC